MIREYDKKIILEDGAEFYGFGFGDDSEKIVEVVFNTSMVGYQEILSDPSYTGQAVVMTYPLIGNYGICTDDYETKVPTISALIVREYNEQPSNFRAEETLEQVMQRHRIAGIAGVDSRRLARHIRDKGTCKGLITQGSTPIWQVSPDCTARSSPQIRYSRSARKRTGFPLQKNQNIMSWL